jgi:DNA-binding response OmpR family regulator
MALTPKEFRLLEYFARRAGRAFTRDQLLNAVWGEDLIVTQRSVDRCINPLRAKIEPDPEHPRFIKTIRDVGYRFEVG